MCSVLRRGSLHAVIRVGRGSRLEALLATLMGGIGWSRHLLLLLPLTIQPWLAPGLGRRR